jgi:hypothetical protein
MSSTAQFSFPWWPSFGLCLSDGKNGIIRNQSYPRKPGPYGHIPVASSFSPCRPRNSSKSFGSLFDVGLQWEAMWLSTSCSRMDVCLGKRGWRVEEVPGDPSPQALICLVSFWDVSPFDVGNQLITGWNWFEGLGNSLKACTLIWATLGQLSRTSQAKEQDFICLALSPQRFRRGPFVLPWYYLSLADHFPLQSLCLQWK